jgi:hypothetical protein
MRRFHAPFGAKMPEKAHEICVIAFDSHNIDALSV